MNTIDKNIGDGIDGNGCATACRTGGLLISTPIANSPVRHATKKALSPPIAKSPLKAQLLSALMIAQPGIGKDYLYERCVNKYMAAMLPAINAAIAMNHKSNDLLPNQFTFSQTLIREAIGTIGKQQDYIYYLMQEQQATSLIVIARNGFSKNGVSKLSIASLNPIYEDLIVDELLNLRVPDNQKLLDEIERDDNYEVRIDPASLKSYINKTTETLRATSKSSNYREALLRNLSAAKQLLSMLHPADATHTTPYIKELWKQADSGRIYGRGYSLQRMPKEVRHAALGVCHKYDFKACAFALMTGLAHAINPNLRIGATLDYIKNRQLIRQRIAHELNISESLVKTIFTALGFGAELKNNHHNAIRGALARAARQKHDMNIRLNKEAYNNLGADEYARLVANQTFRHIYDELQQINTTILDYLSNDEIKVGDLRYSATDPKTGKRRTDRQKLAWIYQALEFMAMMQFAELAKQEPLLTTHDCIYFKQKLPAETVKDITYCLQLTYPFLRFEHEAIFPIAEDAYYAARFADADLFEQQHREFIAAETLRAEIYYSRLPESATAH